MFRTALAALALSVAAISARADTITLDAANSSGGTYKYNFSQSNSLSNTEIFATGSTFTISGLSGVTGASAAFPGIFAASFTSTSASFTVNSPGVGIGPGTYNDFFTVTSSVLTLGAAQYSIPTTPSPATGSVLGPVAAAASVTPEPSSFALLATGMLGAAGVLRKRFA